MPDYNAMTNRALSKEMQLSARKPSGRQGPNPRVTLPSDLYHEIIRRLYYTGQPEAQPRLASTKWA